MACHPLGAFQNTAIPLDGLHIGAHELFHLGRRLRTRSMLAQEVSDSFGGGVFQHLLWRGHLHNFSAIHEDDDIGQLQCLIHVMGDENDGLSKTLLQVFHFVLKSLPRLRIQCAKGFVHQYNRRRGRQSPQDAYTLLLTAGKLGGVLFSIVLHTNQFQHLLHDLSTAGLVVFEEFWDNGNILGYGHIWEQADLLNHIADMAAQLHLVLQADILPIDGDDAGVRFQEPVDEFHGGGLTTPGWADQYHELSIRNREIQIFQDDGFSITFGDMLKLNHRASFRGGCATSQILNIHLLI